MAPSTQEPGRVPVVASPRRVLDALVAIALPYAAHAGLLAIVFSWERRALGRESSAALAAFQVGSVVVYNLVTILSAGSLGLLAVVARAHGRGDAVGERRAIAAALVLAALLGVAGAAATFAALEPLLALLAPGASSGVHTQAAAYLSIVAPTLPLVLVEAVLAAAYRGRGDARTPLRVAIIGAAVNVGVASVLLFGPAHLGLSALAIGTAAGTLLQLVAFVVVARGRTLVRRAELDLRALLASARDIVRHGGVVIGDRAVECLGFTLFVLAIGRLGDAAMAANQAILATEAFGLVIVEALGVATAACVARSGGPITDASGQRVLRSAAWVATMTLGIVGALFVLAPGALLGVFTEDASVVAVGASALIVVGITQPFIAYASVAKMAMRGAGDTRRALLVGVAGTVVVRLPLTFVLGHPRVLGLAGAWIACGADWVVQAVLARAACRARGHVEGYPVAARPLAAARGSTGAVGA